MTAKHPREVEAERQKELSKKEIEIAKEELRYQVDEYLSANETIKKEETRIDKLLHNPKLLDVITSEIQDKKVVGEKQTIETVFIVSNCRKVLNIKPTSSNLLINDETGLGKDFVTKSTLDIIPKEDVVYRRKITQELFTYWHNPKFEPDWTWDNKINLIIILVVVLVLGTNEDNFLGTNETIRISNLYSLAY